MDKEVFGSIENNRDAVHKDNLVKLANIIKSSKYCVVLTGAGVSTESGIPDFRSPDTGLWTKVDPMAALSNTTFRTDPVGFYQFIEDMMDVFFKAEPNECHKAIAELEGLGYIKTVITQNIDGLHRRAGSQNMLEVHGNTEGGKCIRCDKTFSMDHIMKLVKAGELPPTCEECGSLIKPNIVLFEDQLPIDFVLAQEEIKKSDLLIVIGSSLQVAPVCYLPTMSRRFSIINLMPTPYDSYAESVIQGKAGTTMKMIKELVTSSQ